MVLDLRPSDPLTDRAATQAVLRAAFARDDTGYTIHPGDWDWWCFHPDPRNPPSRVLLGDRVLAEVQPHNNELSVFGATPAELGAVIDELEPPITSVGWVLASDTARHDVLTAHGFAPKGEPWPLFLRPAAGGVEHGHDLAAGFTIRPIGGADEAASRANAARRAFKSTMEPAMHVARYRSFMASPAYERERDIVAIAPDGRVASFAIHWPDRELSVAQFEPVGTDPDFVRLGLSRAVIANSLERIVAAGARTARVTTHGGNTEAEALYLSCGFAVVDHIEWWHRSP
jgi:GNAT superfamily N-acetyltransferase